ncbi:hypothetical protein Tco_0624334 [Tanacetum coccineum]|uniref:Uncharacterized protein n=1 Tax=Tanacetum coccineum TaxID=301880 RepID=A0ABQ4WDL7_9ASTR
METKDTLSSCSNSEDQQMQQIQDKAKESCMVSFRRLHSYLNLLSNNDLKGTRSESGFKRAFATLFGQDLETFTGIMFLNMDQLEKQLDNEEFKKLDPWLLLKYSRHSFRCSSKFRDTLMQHMESVKKSIDERTLHKREYDTKVNERQMQTTEGKVDCVYALDGYVYIRPIYDKEQWSVYQTLKKGIMVKFLKVKKVKSIEAKVKHDIDVIETINIELEHNVAKLLKENETLKKHYKELYDSIKTTRARNIEHTTSLIANNDDFKAQLQEKGFAIAALKKVLRKLTGNSVNTKFAKSSILGKPVLQPHRNQSVIRQPTAFKSERPRISKP